jgi:hypothetical protein
MIKFLKTYKAFAFGFVIEWILIWLFLKIEFILIDPTEVIVNTTLFIAYWFIISLPIHKFSYLKKKRVSIFKTLGLLLIFIIILVVDDNMKMSDNPITILLIVCFFLVAFYIISPVTFKKYKYYIVAFYVLTLIYFAEVRLNNETEIYLQKKKESFLLFFIPIPIVISMWVYEQWKWFQNLKTEKAKAELAMLKTQVNPHFFFNTLNNLYALTVKNSNKAPEVILKLSDMMRYAIYEGEKDIVFLKDEISCLENYIELHKIRYHKNVKIEFTHTINKNETIAPLLFIIFLENAFKHGVEALTENAFITINLISNEDCIHFTIENNFDSNEISEKKGIGLDNLKRRLALIYSDNHELSIQKKDSIYKADLKIYNK